MKQIFEKPFVYPAIVLSIAFIVGSLIGGVFISQIKNTANSLSTTGSAKMSVTSDLAKINASFSRTVSESGLSNGYVSMKRDEDKIKAFLVSKGLAETEFTILPISLSERYDYSPDAASKPKQYDLRQEVKIESSDTAKITTLASASGELINQGVFYQSYGVQYFYSKLSEARIQLMEDAIKDAKVRADEIAKGAGSRVGKILTASSGVVQVLAPNSLDVSDYGSYDTSTPEKEIMVTVRATFKVK
jgi:hypothetical protein